MREDIAFKTEDGVTLRGWHFVPEGRSQRFPTIVMAHGFSGVKEMYLDDFAKCFADAGLAAIVFDNRNFGASDDQPRQEINPHQQISDYRDAITFAETLPQTDSARIGVWGSSFSGGHVLVVGATDRRVKCVVSQVPSISGYANSRRMTRPDLAARMNSMLDADRRNRYQGKPSAMLPVISENPAGPAALPQHETWVWFTDTSKSRAPAWKNEITLRSVEMVRAYEPGNYIPQISPTPLLMIVALEDHVAFADEALAAYERALEPKKLVMLKGGHFDAYGKHLRTAAEAGRDWFIQHLCQS